MRRILRVSWTAEKTNEWVLNTAGATQELLDFVKARKLAYCGHITRKQTMYGLDKQHQHVDQTYCGGINENDKRQRSME